MSGYGRSCRMAASVAAGFVAVVFFSVRLEAAETALDRYVHKPDSTYSWNVVSTAESEGLTLYIVDLKSQTWRTEKDVDRPVWQHWVSIARPAKPTSSTAFLMIGGSENGGQPPKSPDARTIETARATNSVVVELKMVPNQPLVFHNDGVGRKEDDLIAYTWMQFLNTGDETWPARLPMVKSAVRTMDCVQELMAGEQGGKIRIDKFVVAGGSKRGWTTWCTAAVDKRVAAAIPIVIDVVNVPACSRHHVAAYGFHARSIGDYVRHGLTRRMEDDKTKVLYGIEDPYSYRDRLTMPKFVLNASGDQFFPPDSSQFYYGDLVGEKYLRYVPNADHGLRGTDGFESAVAFYQTVLEGKRRPSYSWTFDSDGSIRVRTPDAPKTVTLWHATNPTARDFRVAKIGRAYKEQPLQDEGGGVYVGKITPPESGWTAFFVELTYDVGVAYPFKVSTAVRVLPDTLPFPNLDPKEAPLEGDGAGG